MTGSFMSWSPDDRSIAMARRIDGNQDIWTMDLSTGALQRITLHSAHEASPVWSPDSSQIIFGSDRRSGVLDLYVKKLNGAPETLLIESATDKTATDWSYDGRWIAYADTSAKTGRDVWAWPVARGQKPIPIANSAAREPIARFSPDGRWVAFQSDESSRFEIYVQRFPNPAGRIQITTEGGLNPHWSRDGRELFYRNQTYTMSVPITIAGDSLTRGTPVRLFEAPSGADIEPSSDGQRFLTTRATEAPSLVTLLVNWSGASR